MTGLLNVESVRVPEELAIQANAHLLRMGRQGDEGFALWAGNHVKGVFYVKQTIIPAQIPIKLPSGVCIYVDAQELHRLNVWLFEHSMTLIAQIHSHPTEAYHSDTDNLFPIATSLGSFSIVVPNYAREPFSLLRCAVYRLGSDGWSVLSLAETKRVFQITR